MAPAGIAVTVEKDVRAPLEATFRAIVPIELARIFRGVGPLPAVVGTREQTGAWDHVGASRIVELSDGSQAHEQLMAYEPPRHFAYRLDGFTWPLRGLVSHGRRRLVVLRRRRWRHTRALDVRLRAARRPRIGGAGRNCSAVERV
jgi:hypothetical protein